MCSIYTMCTYMVRFIYLKKYDMFLGLFLPFLIIPMDCIKKQFKATFMCLVIYVITLSTADQQNSSSFLSIYARQQDICHKMGWKPSHSKSKLILIQNTFFVFILSWMILNIEFYSLNFISYLSMCKILLCVLNLLLMILWINFVDFEFFQYQFE